MGFFLKFWMEGLKDLFTFHPKSVFFIFLLLVGTLERDVINDLPPREVGIGEHNFEQNRVFAIGRGNSHKWRLAKMTIAVTCVTFFSKTLHFETFRAKQMLDGKGYKVHLKLYISDSQQLLRGLQVTAFAKWSPKVQMLYILC